MPEYIQSLPIFITFILIVFLILVCFEMGFQISLRTHRKPGSSIPQTMGQISAALLGMLAFVLAFTFSMAASQHNLRKEMVLEEANAVGTAYLRSDLIPPMYGEDLKSLLREYVAVRLKAANKAYTQEGIRRSEQLHPLMWQQARAAALNASNTNSALLVEAINEVIDMHEKRVTASLRNKIPASIWITLFAISFLAMAIIGIESGFSKSRRLLIVVPMVFAFAALITLIVELNRPQEGLIQVGQQSMISLQKSMALEVE